MTGEDQQLLASVLDDLAESPAPPSGMDTCRAIRDGRRLRLRRRLVAGGAVLALVAASVGTAAALTHHSPAPPALPAPPHWTGSASPHDPATVTGGFGWLPPGVTADGYWGYTRLGFGMPVDAVALGATPATGPTVRPMLTLYLYPIGLTPTVPVGQGVTGQPGSPPPKSHHIPAPDVDGRQAYWASSSATDALDDDRPMLRWRTADGRWAELTASGFPAQGLEQTMLRTAAGITLGTRPVPLPFYISGWPVPTQVGTFNLSADAVQELNMHGWGFGIEFAVSGYRFGVSVSQYVTAPENFNTPGQTTVWAEANGMLYRIDHEGYGKLPRALTAIGGLQGLLKRLTVLGPDPQNWTTDVLR